MNKNILILFGLGFVVVLLFVFSGGPGEEIKNYPSTGKRILAFGDSLVEGVGSTKENDLFSVLERKIGQPIENYGRAGDTTGSALERLPLVLEEVPNPKVVVILLGGNDFLRKVPKNETFENLAKIITAFQERGAVVLLLGIRGGILKDNFDSEFRELVKSHKTAYVGNVLGGLITKRELMSDSIHPNDEGYKIIADRVYPTLRDLIE